jgi:hypothetical protein
VLEMAAGYRVRIQQLADVKDLIFRATSRR